MACLTWLCSGSARYGRTRRANCGSASAIAMAVLDRVWASTSAARFLSDIPLSWAAVVIAAEWAPWGKEANETSYHVLLCGRLAPTAPRRGRAEEWVTPRRARRPCGSSRSVLFAILRFVVLPHVLPHGAPAMPAARTVSASPAAPTVPAGWTPLHPRRTLFMHGPVSHALAIDLTGEGRRADP